MPKAKATSTSTVPTLFPSLTSYVGTPPMVCDLCHLPMVDGAFVDGKTTSGPWANMCSDCHKTDGVGLGTGKGQRYEVQPDGKWSKMVPAEEIQEAIRTPSLATMRRWIIDGVAKATDGCRVEPDGTCPHGKPSWLLKMGLV